MIVLQIMIIFVSLLFIIFFILYILSINEITYLKNEMIARDVIYIKKYADLKQRFINDHDGKDNAKG